MLRSLIRSSKLLHLAFLVTLLLTLQMASAMPTPEQIAQFKADYKVQLDQWLDTKTNQTANCLESLIVQLDKCRHSPYD